MSERRNLRKGENTRRRFMDAARLVFLRDGYLNAEISAISRAAGNSAGAYYIYFDNKSAMLDALLDEFDVSLSGETGSPSKHFHRYFQSQTPENLHERIRAVWDTYKIHASAFYALAQASMVDRHFAKRERDIRQRAVDDIRNMIQARQELGLCKQLDLQYSTQSLEIMLTHTMHDWLAVRRRQFRNAKEEKRALDSMVNIFSSVLELEVSGAARIPRKRASKQRLLKTSP